LEALSVVATVVAEPCFFGDFLMAPAAAARTAPPADPRGNQRLAALAAVEYDRWSAQLEFVDRPLGQVLYESGGTMTHVYFPTTAIVSLLYVLENGSSAEIAVVGNEGIVGVSLFMGGGSTPSRAVVQSAGNRFRMNARGLNDEFNRAGPVLHLLLRYTQALITQMAQTAVCNRHHTLDQPLCRWLLLSLDRLQGDDPRADRQHAGCAPRRRERKRVEAASRAADPLFARPHHGARPRGPGSALVRVLSGGEKRVRTLVAGTVRDLTHTTGGSVLLCGCVR
jgi:hypothetical protein